MLGARLALGYTGRKDKVADLMELTIQGDRQTSHQAAALNMRKAVDQTEGSLNNLQKLLGRCFLEEVTGHLSWATGAKRAAQWRQENSVCPGTTGRSRSCWVSSLGRGQSGQTVEGMDEPCMEWGSKPRGDLEQGSGIFREGRRGRGVSEEVGATMLGCLWLGQQAGRQ